MWGTTPFGDELTDHFDGAFAATSIDGCRLFRRSAENLPHDVLGLLQHNQGDTRLAIHARARLPAMMSFKTLWMSALTRSFSETTQCRVKVDLRAVTTDALAKGARCYDATGVLAVALWERGQGGDRGGISKIIPTGTGTDR